VKYLEEEFKILIDEGGEQTRYTISNYGRVFDTFKNTYVSQVLTGKPEYFYVNYYDNTGKRKLRRVHNLIARTWIHSESETYTIVDHIDKNRYNNSIDNLRWTDKKGNSRNKHNTVYLANGDPLIAQTSEYDNAGNAYAYIMRCIKENNLTPDAAISRYDKFLSGELKENLLDSTLPFVYCWWLKRNMRLDHYCELIYCEKPMNLFKNYKNTITEVELLIGLKYKNYNYSFETKSDDISVSMWMPNKVVCSFTETTNQKLIDKVIDYKQAVKLDWFYRNNKIPYLYNKDYFTIDDLVRKFNKGKNYILSRIQEGMSPEDIEKEPQPRIRMLTIDGDRRSLKQWLEFYNISPKEFNTKRSKTKISLEDMFLYYGVDLSSFEISYT